MMVAAADDRDDLPISGEISALLSTIETYRRDNERLAARVAELEAKSGDLRPLKALLETESEYERARRSARRGLLQSEQRGGRLFSTSNWVDEWRKITGR